MNEQERESLRNVVVYLINKEHDDYEEQDEEGKRDHIYRDLVKLNRYLDRSDDLDKSTSHALAAMTRTAVEYHHVLSALFADGRLDQLGALMVRKVLDQFGADLMPPYLSNSKETNESLCGDGGVATRIDGSHRYNVKKGVTL